MATCGYGHIVLSGFQSSNGVFAHILLKFELFIPSSAIANTLVTLRPTVIPTRYFMLIGRKMRFKLADSSICNENEPCLIDFMNHKVFSIVPQNTDYSLIVGRQSADYPPTDQTVI